MVHRAERSSEVFTELHNHSLSQKSEYVYNDSSSKTAMFIVLKRFLIRMPMSIFCRHLYI